MFFKASYEEMFNHENFYHALIQLFRYPLNLYNIYEL